VGQEDLGHGKTVGAGETEVMLGRDKSQPDRIEPGPGQESVWDYPRPPAVDPALRHIEVIHRGLTIVDSHRPIRILETSQPPAYYVPPDDVRMDLLFKDKARTYCEWKGAASYYGLRLPDGEVVFDVAWSYLTPNRPYAAIAGWLAFYAQKVDECRVDGEVVHPNPGAFYGGWITSDVVGPFKGSPGTQSW
jgi:uncharacterized protein (DUF427 family)